MAASPCDEEAGAAGGADDGGCNAEDAIRPPDTPPRHTVYAVYLGVPGVMHYPICCIVLLTPVTDWHRVCSETSQTRLGFPIELMAPLDVKPEKGGHYQCHHRRKRRR